MSAPAVLESQQSVHAAPAAAAGRAAPGSWKLAAGRALSLHPRQPGVLEIAQGRVWVTLSGPLPPQPLPADLPGGGADHVLQAGDRLAVATGQHVVMQPWPRAGRAQDGAAFHWHAAGAAALAPVPAPRQRARRPAAEWECGVVQPLRELGQAGAQALGATQRLARGFARFALFWIAAPRAGRPA